MLVTVAIPTHNRASLLRQTLEGIARQDFPRDQFEVLVVDNNSTDGTRAVAEAFARPNFRYLLETRQGLDHARNRAIDEAAGEIVLFGDDDILMEPDWIARMAAPFAAHREGAEKPIGAVGGEVIPVFPDGLPRWLEGAHTPLAYRRDPGPIPEDKLPMGANFAFPRRVFQELGPFHGGLDRQGNRLFGGGDAEMVRRVRAAGYEVWFSPDAPVRHQIPASRLTLEYALRHAFDSARSRVLDRASRSGARSYLLSRLPANLAKAPGFALLALGFALILRTGDAKKALVRAWRSCGYVAQIVLSLPSSKPR
jgi:glycosyltransferase involved in cell wall biosynthesis